MWAVYCSEQLDGIAAAAILFRYARLRKAKIRLGGFLNYQNIEEKFQEMSNLKGDLIFILDFPPEQIQNLEDKFKQISKNNKLAYWNCHHPYDAATISTMMKYIHSLDFSGTLKNSTKKESKLCSADLTCNKFLPKDLVAIELKTLAHDIEFWIRQNQTAIKLADLIQSGFNKKELVDILSRGVVWSDRFEKIKEEYLQKKTKALNDLMKNLVIKKYVDLRFGFALSSSILGTADAGQKMLDSHTAIDVSIILFRNGKISFRRKDNIDMDLSKIGELFDGGGHPYASGGRIQKNISSENLDKIIFLIDRKLKDFFLD
jgi:oligoribonuclease NrnB/cAMP/cGMP phosphodiesterase (DHH superfamily)